MSAAAAAVIRVGIVSGALGSASVSFQPPSSSTVSSTSSLLTTSSDRGGSDCLIICAVHGPHYNTAAGGSVGNLSHAYMDSNSIEERGSIVVGITGISEASYDQDGTSDVQLAYLVRCALLPLIMIDKYKGCFFTVNCMVEGSIRPNKALYQIINCCGLALLNASIEMKDLPVAVIREVKSSSSTTSSSFSDKIALGTSMDTSTSSSSSSSAAAASTSMSLSLSSPLELEHKISPTSYLTICYSLRIDALTLTHSSGRISDVEVMSNLNDMVRQCKDLRSHFRTLLLS